MTIALFMDGTLKYITWFITTALEDVLNHPDASLDICVTALRDAHRHDCKELAIEALQNYKRKMIVSTDREKIDQLHLVSVD